MQVFLIKSCAFSKLIIGVLLFILRMKYCFHHKGNVNVITSLG